MPLTVLNDNWVCGGAAQVGTTYAFAGGWFLDFAYTYARSANFTIANPVFVHNQIGRLTLSGPAVLNTQASPTLVALEVRIDPILQAFRRQGCLPAIEPLD